MASINQSSHIPGDVAWEHASAEAMERTCTTHDMSRRPFFPRIAKV